MRHINLASSGICRNAGGGASPARARRLVTSGMHTRSFTVATSARGSGYAPEASLGGALPGKGSPRVCLWVSRHADATPSWPAMPFTDAYITRKRPMVWQRRRPTWVAQGAAQRGTCQYRPSRLGNSSSCTYTVLRNAQPGSTAPLLLVVESDQPIQTCVNCQYTRRGWQDGVHIASRACHAHTGLEYRAPVLQDSIASRINDVIGSQLILLPLVRWRCVITCLRGHYLGVPYWAQIFAQYNIQSLYSYPTWSFVSPMHSNLTYRTKRHCAFGAPTLSLGKRQPHQTRL